ncbi:MAG: bifunctional hydroxymethylpyrimidine kinase/phosphomethylpyrimidine kinase [Xanthomonadales bacterium]|nr:bifunctional hydroxymethylpyrimidine kinase/phosphomethylpyrimidine kinase [Xanthomonadales bacterium]
MLTVAGSDSGGGAGIQADLKAFAAHGVHGLSVVTAVTAQNTRAVPAVHPVPLAIVRAQLEAVFDDFSIRAAKTGMLASPALVRLLGRWFSARPEVPLVVDPVMVASSGARLISSRAAAAIRRHLLPQATLITPNLPEAAALLGRPLGADLDAAARALGALGPRAVLLKGGHAPGEAVIDRLWHRGAIERFEHPRLPAEGHGTGCALAAAIAARLARGEELAEAVRGAIDYVHGALARGAPPGLGRVSVLDLVARSA